MPITDELPVFRKAVYALLLLIAVALIYGQFLWNPIVFDDIQLFMVGEDTLKYYLDFIPFEIRWLPTATIAWTAYGIGLDMIWFRLEGLALHAATGIALFFFLQRLFELTLNNGEGRQVAFPGIWIAFFCALFFVWHPVAVYGAGYLIQRTIVMATLFGLLTLYVYMRGLTENRPRWLWGSVFLYYMAVFSKEHVVMLPAVMLALTMLLERPSSALWKRLWSVYVVCALIAAFVFLQKMGLLGSVYEIAAPEMLEKIEVKNAYFLSVLTQSFLFFKYWFLWLLPNPSWMSVDMREPFATQVFSGYLLALLAFVAYGAVAIKLLFKRGEMGLLGFALLYPWLLFATEFSTVRIQESFVLYRSYLWMAGGFAALPLLLKYLRPQIIFVGMLPVALILAMLSVNRLTIFSDPLLLWDDALMLVKNRPDLPGVDRIYFNRSKYLTGIKRYREALTDMQTVVTLNPNFFYYRYGLGAAYMNMARYPDAIVEFNKAIDKEPEFFRAYFGRGLAELEVGNQAAALADFEKSCSYGWKSGCARAQILREKTGG